ncbi:hypothetical protein E3E22_09755 [Thermococcus sp. MV5]|uniref:hypothetical protein n=1 Tax=Thermococcus sp. MV5 TaxID=1638272 RepID=UPI00143A09CF|nr:hypothetical protein [Thermococcus sp. MV5]NJE26890.1 hypothetical protein [Thermococcus sp. MV5]
MKKVLSFLFIALLLVSIFSTYSWWQCRKEKEKMLVQIYNEFEVSRWELEHTGETFQYLLQNNVSQAVLLLYLEKYQHHVLVVRNTFGILASHSEEEKFRKLHVAMKNLFDVLTSIRDNPESLRENLQSNLEALREFDKLFKELSQYQSPNDIPDELAENFLEVSKELTESER